MKYELKYNKNMIASNIVKAESFWEKFRGLMLSENLGDKGGLLFETQSIHTHFMRYPIDVIFLSKNYKIVKVLNDMKPWRMTKIYFKAKYAIELKAGTLGNDLKAGDQVEVICIS